MTYLLRLSACLLLCVSLNSFGGLHTRDLDGDLSNGHEGVYDDVLDITWLAKPCTQMDILALFLENGCHIPELGQISWMWDTIQTQYLSRLNNHNDTGFWGVNNWRLATMTPASPEGTNEFGQFTFNYDCGHVYACNKVTHDGSGDRGYNISRTTNELGYHYYINFGLSPGVGVDDADATSNEEAMALFDLDFFIPRAPNNDKVRWFLMNKSDWRGSPVGPCERSQYPCNSGVYFDFGSGRTTIDSNASGNVGVWLVFDGDIAPKSGVGRTAGATTPDGSVAGQLHYKNITDLNDGDYYSIVQPPNDGLALVDKESGQWLYKTNRGTPGNDFFVVKIIADNGTTFYQNIEIAITEGAATKNVPAMGGLGMAALLVSMLSLGTLRLRKK